MLIILAMGMMVFSGTRLWEIYDEYAAGEEIYDNYVDKFVNNHQVAEAAEVEELEVSEEVSEEISKSSAPISIDFDAIFAENKDIVGWIYSEGTPINYPIVQSSDNDYYLRRMLDGSYNIAGSIFMDYRNSADLTDSNTIIYGHNMKNETMFGTLEEYMDQDYYDNHPVIHYITPDESYEIQLITGYITDAWSDTYSIPQNPEELGELTSKMVSKSSFTSNYSFDEGDNLITLSTCAYDFNDARYVVVGKIL